MLTRANTNGILAYPAFACLLLYKTYPAPIKVKIVNITLNTNAVFSMVSSLSTPICSFDYTTFIPYLPLKDKSLEVVKPCTFYRHNNFLFCISVLSNRSASHTDYCILSRIFSCAPTGPALPPGNPALSFSVDCISRW